MQDLLDSIKARGPKPDGRQEPGSVGAATEQSTSSSMNDSGKQLSAASVDDGGLTQASTAGESFETAPPSPAVPATEEQQQQQGGDEAVETTLNDNSDNAAANVSSKSLVSGGYEDVVTGEDEEEEHLEESQEMALDELQQEQEQIQQEEEEEDEDGEYDPALEDSFIEEEIIEDSEGFMEEEYVIEDGDPDERLEGIMEETADILRQQGEDVPSVSLSKSSSQQQEQQAGQEQEYQEDYEHHDPPAPMQDVEVLEGDDIHSVQSALSHGTSDVKSVEQDSYLSSAREPSLNGKSTQSTPSEAAFRAADHLLGQQEPQQQPQPQPQPQPQYQTPPHYDQAPPTQQQQQHQQQYAASATAQDDASRQSSRKSSVRSAAEVAATVGVATPPQAASQQQQEEDPYLYIKRQSGSGDSLNGGNNHNTHAQDPSAINMRLSRPAREPSGNVVLRNSGPPSHRYGDDPAKIKQVPPTPPVRQQQQQQQRAVAPAVRAQAAPPPAARNSPQQQQRQEAARNAAPVVAAAAAVTAAPRNNNVPPTINNTSASSMASSGPDVGDGKVRPDPKDNKDPQQLTDDDIETGDIANNKDGGTAAKAATRSGNKGKGPEQSQLPPPSGPDNRGALKVMGALVCLVAIVLAIVLPLTLRDDDDSAPRDVAIPTPPPAVAQGPPGPPTPSPTAVVVAWEEVFPTMGGPLGSGFGSAVALDETVLAVGAPQHNATGGVFTAVNAGENWELVPAILGQEDGSDFGASLDIQAGQMIVGAPLVNLADSLSPVGAAYFFAFNPPAKQWDQIGPVLRGDQDILAAGGRYGAAVALGLGDSLPRVVVAAPLSALDVETFEVGRVYTYEGTGIAWNTLETEPLVGTNALDWFGSSVDMISDGSLFIVGAPGQENAGMNGYFRIYSWTDDGAWTMEYQIDGEDGEALGSTVVALSDSVFAVGAPEHKDGRGRVSLYERSGMGQYAWIAQVEGNAKERIGRANSVTGSFSEDERLLIVATQAGDIVTYEYTDGGVAEKAPVKVHNTGFPDVVVEYSSTDGLATGTAEGDEITVLEVSAPKVVLPVDSSPTTTTQAPAVEPFPNLTTTATGAPAGSPTVAQITATDASNDSAMGWTKRADNFQPKVDGANFGTAVSLASSRLAVGGPFTLGNGAALVYQKIDGVWETTASGQLFGESEGDEFGAAVDVTDRLLIVGAPGVLVNGTLTESGAAYCYISNGGEWQKLGPTLRGDETVFGANELFGAAVAASTTGVVLVGAPGSAVGIEVGSQGRVYVFELDDSQTQWTLALDIFSKDPNVALGSALGIARDGSHFVIGAKGRSGAMGYVEIYQNAGNEFILAGVLRSTEENDGYGTAVSVISPTGDIIAVGAPDDLNGRGRVYVYQKNTAGTYIQVGDPIVGETGESLGEMVAGESSSPRVFLGTAQGRVKQFNYDPGLTAWVSGGTVDTGLGSNLLALAVSSQSQAFAAGGNNDAAIYEPPIDVR